MSLQLLLTVVVMFISK